MPFAFGRDVQACSASKPFAVKNTDTGRVLGCHETREGARRQLAALQAQGADETRQGSGGSSS